MTPASNSVAFCESIEPAPILTVANQRFQNLWIQKLAVLKGAGTVGLQNAANEIQLFAGVICILSTPSSHILNLVSFAPMFIS
jgi:hypothetical protein